MSNRKENEDGCIDNFLWGVMLGSIITSTIIIVVRIILGM